MSEKNPRAKQPNDIVNVNLHPTVTKTFLDILDMVSAAVNQEDDDPDQLVYSLSLNSVKEFKTYNSDKNFFAKIRNEGSKDILHCPYNFFEVDTDEGEHIESVYISGFRWKDDDIKNNVDVVLALDYKNLLNATKGMTYFNPIETIAMSSKYARSMYLRLLKQINMSKMKFSAKGSLRGKQFTYYEPIEQFREKLGIPATYKFSNIKKACDIIVKEIGINTGYNAEVFYNLAKLPACNRPKVTHIAWLMEKKQIEIVEPEDYRVEEPGKDPEQLDVMEMLLSADIMKITKLDNISAMSIAHNATLHAVPKDKVIATCSYAMNQTVDNLGGYINALISRGGFSPDMANDPQSERKQRKKGNPARTKFNSFDQREYSSDQLKDLENKLFNQ